MFNAFVYATLALLAVAMAAYCFQQSKKRAAPEEPVKDIAREYQAQIERAQAARRERSIAIYQEVAAAVLNLREGDATDAVLGVLRGYHGRGELNPIQQGDLRSYAESQPNELLAGMIGQAITSINPDVLESAA